MTYNVFGGTLNPTQSINFAFDSSVQTVYIGVYSVHVQSFSLFLIIYVLQFPSSLQQLFLSVSATLMSKSSIFTAQILLS